MALIISFSADLVPSLELWLISGGEATPPVPVSSYGLPKSAREVQVRGCDTLPSPNTPDITLSRDFHPLASHELLHFSFYCGPHNPPIRWRIQHVFAPLSLFLKSTSGYTGTTSTLPFDVWSAGCSHVHAEDTGQLRISESHLQGARFVRPVEGAIEVWDFTKPRGAYLGSGDEHDLSVHLGPTPIPFRSYYRPVDDITLEGLHIGRKMIDHERIVLVPVSPPQFLSSYLDLSSEAALTPSGCFFFWQ